MKRYKHKEIKFSKSHGAAMMIFTIFIFFTSFMIIVGISRPALREFAITQNAFNSRQTYFLSESGVEDAFYRIKNGKQVGASESLVLGSTTSTTTISDIGGGQKQISSLSSTNNHQRKVNLVLEASAGSSTINIDFSQGLVSGTSGVTLSGGVKVIGDLYTAGPIYSYADSVYGNGGVPNTIQGNASSGGSSGRIEVRSDFGSNELLITGDAAANTVIDTDANGTIYCQSGSGNNKSCNTSRSNPTSPTIPDLSTEIASWKAEAAAGEVLSYNTGTGPSRREFGPTKINGNFQVNYGDPLILTGPLWITGDFTALGDGVDIILDTKYGSGDGVIIVDGTISMGAWNSSQNMTVTGSGTAGSYVLIAGTSSTTYHQINKVSGDLVLYTPNNTIPLFGGAQIRGVISKRIGLAKGAYGLTDVNYSTGPSSLNVGPDVFSIKSWKEAQ